MPNKDITLKYHKTLHKKKIIPIDFYGLCCFKLKLKQIQRALSQIQIYEKLISERWKQNA